MQPPPPVSVLPVSVTAVGARLRDHDHVRGAGIGLEHEPRAARRTATEPSIGPSKRWIRPFSTSVTKNRSSVPVATPCGARELATGGAGSVPLVHVRAGGAELLDAVAGVVDHEHLSGFRRHGHVDGVVEAGLPPLATPEPSNEPLSTPLMSQRCTTLVPSLVTYTCRRRSRRCPWEGHLSAPERGHEVSGRVELLHPVRDRSVTYTLPAESVATPLGWSNWPAPVVPSRAHTKVPSA